MGATKRIGGAKKKVEIHHRGTEGTEKREREIGEEAHAKALRREGAGKGAEGKMGPRLREDDGKGAAAVAARVPEWVFPGQGDAATRCPRCRAGDTVRVGQHGGTQYRECRRGTCRARFSVAGRRAGEIHHRGTEGTEGENAGPHPEALRR